MRKLLAFLLLCLLPNLTHSQELRCNVNVVAQLTGNENRQVFRTLEQQLTEFINSTAWTDKKFKQNERIDCSMVITVNSYNNDLFSASLQVQSSRPVFNSTYSTPIYNFNDQNFNFKYLEFQNLVFNPNQFESNLISVIAFHVYMVLGLDADSFKLNGGLEYLKQALIIANYSQSAGAGWTLQSGPQSRFAMVDGLLSPTFEEYRTTLYNYHIDGLDLMSEDPRAGKEQIVEHLQLLKKMHSRRPNSFLMRVFFDAKADEITDIFAGGPNVNITELSDLLNTIAPTYSTKWNSIRF
ncbi:MAG: DUF4835 family protein [Bacteroidota bacterium]